MFDMEVAPPVPLSLAEYMADKAGLWEEIVRRHGLQAIPYDQVASWFGEPRAISLTVQRQPGTNTVAVVDAIKELLPSINAQLPASVVDDLRELFERYQGDTEFVLEMHTRSGVRRLRFGDAYKVKARDAGFKAELEELLGSATLAAA